MAKYKKKSGNAKGIVIAIVTIVLALALVIASVITTGYLITGTANPAQWGKGEQETIHPDDNFANNGILLFSLDGEESSDLSIVVSQNMLYDRLTAVVYPENSNVEGVEWSVSNNALVLTPVDYDPFSVDVSIANAFEEQIIITCNVINFSSVRAICKVDYFAEPNLAIGVVSGLSGSITLVLDSDDCYDLVIDDYSTTSLEFEKDPVCMTASLTKEAQEIISSYMGFDNGWYKPYNVPLDNADIGKYMFYSPTPSDFWVGFDKADSETRSNYMTAFLKTILEVSSPLVLEVPVSCSYNGKLYYEPLVIDYYTFDIYSYGFVLPTDIGVVEGQS